MELRFLRDSFDILRVGMSLFTQTLRRRGWLPETWFNQEDLVYYLAHRGQRKGYRLLDFKDRQELHYAGDSSLKRGDAF